MGKQVF